MVDVVSKEKRSKMMSGIRYKDTKPEIKIRKVLHAKGFRYSLHNSKLPGKPDIVLPKYNAIIFINGCFWHQHNCHLFKWPSTRTEFWREKISGNKDRDKQNILKLKESSWRILTIWECAIKGKNKRSFDDVIDITSNWIKSQNKEMEILGETT